MAILTALVKNEYRCSQSLTKPPVPSHLISHLVTSAELLLGVTGVTFTFERRVLKPPDNSGTIVTVTESDVSGATFDGAPLPSRTGSADLCIQMTGRFIIVIILFLPQRRLFQQIK